MDVQDTALSGVKLITPRVFEDERGFFFESFNLRNFEAEIGRAVQFVQDNHSRSTKNVLRGLHYQLNPAAQAKLVRVVQGEVFDVVVDIRRGSQTFCKWMGVTLSAENKQQLWIPEGFAHGFLTLSESAELEYKVTDYYHPAYDRAIRWNDEQLAIKWGNLEAVNLSAKDEAASPMSEAELFAI